jgi:hypothetical protein
MNALTVKNCGYAMALVYQNNECIARMDRSPFTGEWTYRCRVELNDRPGMFFSAPFGSTRLKTAKAAAKVAAAAFNA